MTQQFCWSETQIINGAESLHFGPLIDAIEHRFQGSDKPRVLDIGCASGVFGKMLEVRGVDHVYLGMDYCADHMKIGKERYDLHDFVQGDMHHLPFGDDAFDVISIMGAICLAHDPFRVLRELFRVSTSLVAVNTLAPPFGWNTVYLKNVADVPPTLRFDNQQQLSEQLKRNGLPQPDHTLTWQVSVAKDSTYSVTKGLPYRLEDLHIWQGPFNMDEHKE